MRRSLTRHAALFAAVLALLTGVVTACGGGDPGIRVYDGFVRFEYPADLDVLDAGDDGHTVEVGIPGERGLAVVTVAVPGPAVLIPEQAAALAAVALEDPMTVEEDWVPGPWVELPDYAGHPVVARTFSGEPEDGLFGHLPGETYDVLFVGTFDGVHMHTFASGREAPASLDVLRADVEALMESFDG